MKINQYTWDPEKDLIAEGAFAEVFKALDTNTHGRVVALKIYKEAVAKGTAGSSNQKKYSLEEEFRKIDGLSHTNIISYYGQSYIEHKDAMGRSSSYPVIIMEYAQHGTLTDFLKTRPEKNVIGKLISDIIQGVGYLHSEGILHRDLKPGNILITANRKGEPVAKITDFGISRDLLDDQQTLERSMTAGVGTPHYMAPEQFYKKTFGLEGEISERTDLWAIGMIIYKTLTGRLPFGKTKADFEQVRSEIIGQNPNLQGLEDYQAIVMQCLMKKAGQRPAEAGLLLGLVGQQVNEELQAAWSEQAAKGELDPRELEQEPDEKTKTPNTLVAEEQTVVNSPAEPISAPAGPPPRSRKRLPVIAIILFFITALAIAGYYTLGDKDDEIPLETGREVVRNGSDTDDENKQEEEQQQPDNTSTNTSQPQVEEENNTPAVTTRPQYSLVKTSMLSGGEDLSVNHDRKLLLGVGNKQTVLLNSETGNTVKSFSLVDKPSRSTLSNQSSRVMVATTGTIKNGYVLRVVDYDSGNEILRHTESDPSHGYYLSVYSLLFSPDDKYLAVMTDEFTTLINTQTKKVEKIPYGTYLFRDASFSSDSKTLALPSDKDIVIYSLVEKKVLRVLPQGEKLYDLAFFPDNVRLAYTSGQNINIIDTRNNALIRQIKFNNSRNTDLDALAISSGGGIIAASGSDVGGRVKLFNVNGTLIQDIPAHGGYVNRIRFSEDGKMLYSASDGTSRNPIRLWKSDQSIDEANMPKLPRLSRTPPATQRTVRNGASPKREVAPAKKETTTTRASESELWAKAKGSGTLQDYEAYIEAFPKTTNAAEARYLVGNTYLSQKNYIKAVPEIRRSAEAGNARAQNLYGYMFYTGEGVNRSYNKALEWYTKAANQGSGAAQNGLGTMYYSGKGVTQDYEKAFEWFRKAAENDILNAQYLLGYMHEKGQGVRGNSDELVKWYKKAATAGHLESNFRLANFYDKGALYNIYDLSEKWYKKAAELGSLEAQMRLGELYDKGTRGYPLNAKEARKYYKMACDQGDDKGCKALQNVKDLIRVTGKVTDKRGKPLANINILQKGTTRGTVTSARGTYSFDVPAGATLQFRYLKYKTVEMPVNGRTEINVQMRK